MNNDHIYALLKSNNSRAFIDDVPNGQKCGCICSKCRKPLVAKNGGEIIAHHFAHKSDSHCQGESLAHMEAKEIIKNNKYLFVPNLGELVRVKFEKVKFEQPIGSSKFRADIIGFAKGKEVIIEIEVTHDMDIDKQRYIQKNQLTTLCIELSEMLDNHNDLPNDFQDIVLEKSDRYWFYNKREKIRQKTLEKQNEKQRKIAEKKIYAEIKWKEERRNKKFKTIKKNRKMLEKSLKEIWTKNGNKLLEGILVKKHYWKGKSKDSVVVVKSNFLSSNFNYRALAHHNGWEGEVDGYGFLYELDLHRYLGKKVWFRVIYNVDLSKSINLLEGYYPCCLILKLEDGKGVRNIPGLPKGIKKSDFIYKQVNV